MDDEILWSLTADIDDDRVPSPSSWKLRHEIFPLSFGTS